MQGKHLAFYGRRWQISCMRGVSSSKGGKVDDEEIRLSSACDAHLGECGMGGRRENYDGLHRYWSIGLRIRWDFTLFGYARRLLRMEHRDQLNCGDSIGYDHRPTRLRKPFRLGSEVLRIAECHSSNVHRSRYGLRELWNFLLRFADSGDIQLRHRNSRGRVSDSSGRAVRLY